MARRGVGGQGYHSILLLGEGRSCHCLASYWERCRWRICLRAYRYRVEAYALVDLRAKKSTVDGYYQEDPECWDNVATSETVKLITGVQRYRCPVELPLWERFEKIWDHWRDSHRCNTTKCRRPIFQRNKSAIFVFTYHFIGGIAYFWFFIFILSLPIPIKGDWMYPDFTWD